MKKSGLFLFSIGASGILIDLSGQVLSVSCKADKAKVLTGNLLGDYNVAESEAASAVWGMNREKIITLINIVDDFLFDIQKQTEKVMENIDTLLDQIRKEEKNEVDALRKQDKEVCIKVKNAEIRAIDCMAQHIKCLIKQCNKKELANFVEPCEKCPYAAQCDYDWAEIMEPIMRHTNIKRVYFPNKD